MHGFSPLPTSAASAIFDSHRLACHVGKYQDGRRNRRPAAHQPRSADDEALRFARSCYDHLAGKLGVALADALVAKDYIALSEQGGEVTSTGATALSRFGINLDSNARRIYCRPCLDWSERRHHVAGHIGAELLRRCFELGWLTRRRGTRILTLTPAGRRGLHDVFGVQFEHSALLRAG